MGYEMLRLIERIARHTVPLLILLTGEAGTHNTEALSRWKTSQDGSRPASAEVRDRLKDSILGYALTGNAASVRARIEAGESVNERDPKGRTALFFASQAGHREVVTLLLAKGASAAIADDRGRLPLHVAAMFGHEG